ncbi:MAG: hypothetical protein AB7D07_11140 [Desulfovibrionaceae bacterium]
MKKAFLAFVALTALLVFVLFFSLNSIIRNGVESFASKALGVDVSLESASVSFLSGSGDLVGLRASNPKGYPARDALAVQRIHVSLDLASLFSDVIVIREIVVEDPVVHFSTGPDGSNINRLLQNARSSADTAEKKASAQGTEKKAGKPRQVVVDELRITGGRVSLGLAQADARTPDIPIDPIVMRNLGRGGGQVTAAGVLYAVFNRLSGAIFKAALSIGGQAEQLIRQSLDVVKGLLE